MSFGDFGVTDHTDPLKLQLRLLRFVALRVSGFLNPEALKGTRKYTLRQDSNRGAIEVWQGCKNRTCEPLPRRSPSSEAAPCSTW